MKSKVRDFTSIALVLLAAGVFSSGCKRSYNPWAWVPPTQTPTPYITPTPTRTSTETRTFTDTLTVTPTPTISNTPTITSTPTQSPTSTSTETSTLTWTGTWFTDTPTVTDTVTDTPTLTDTPTVTDTPIFTSTRTPTSTFSPTPTCGVGYLPVYSFDSDKQCWRTQNKRGNTVLNWVDAAPGGAQGALSVSLNGMVASTDENFWIDFETPQNLDGRAVSVRIWLSSELMGTASQLGVQPCYASGVTLQQCGIWHAVPSSSANTWVTVSGTITTQTGCWGISNPTSPTEVYSIGFQITGQAGGGTGYAYVDRVWTGSAPTPTPTPTTAVVISDFGMDADNWRAVTTTDYGWYTDPTPTGGAYSASGGNPGGCFAVPFPPLPNDGKGGILRDWGVPVDWSAYTGIMVDVKVDSYTGAPGIQIHILSGADALTGEGTTLAWANVPGNPGVWGTIGRDFGTLTNKAQVTRVIIKINAGGAGTTGAGNFSIDNVRLY